ncbi:MAG: hypothetical protein ACRCX2_18030 [Paraclostridium sp.]
MNGSKDTKQVLSYASAFQNIEANVSVIPRLWETHVDVISTHAFAGNINALNYDKVPLSWGGSISAEEGVLGCYVLLDSFGSFSIPLTTIKLNTSYTDDQQLLKRR